MRTSAGSQGRLQLNDCDANISHSSSVALSANRHGEYGGPMARCIDPQEVSAPEEWLHSSVVPRSASEAQPVLATWYWPQGYSLRDCGNTRFKHLGEIPGTQRDCRAAVSFLHSPSVFSSSQHSVVAITHRLNSVIFNPINTSLFKIISARRPRGGRMAGSL